MHDGSSVSSSRAKALLKYGLGPAAIAYQAALAHQPTPSPTRSPTIAPTITNDKRYLWQLGKCNIKEYLFARPQYCKQYAGCKCCDDPKLVAEKCVGGCTDKHFLNYDPDADYDDKTCSNNPGTDNRYFLPTKYDFAF